MDLSPRDLLSAEPSPHCAHTRVAEYSGRLYSEGVPAPGLPSGLGPVEASTALLRNCASAHPSLPPSLPPCTEVPMPLPTPVLSCALPGAPGNPVRCHPGFLEAPSFHRREPGISFRTAGSFRAGATCTPCAQDTLARRVNEWRSDCLVQQGGPKHQHNVRLTALC